MPIDALVFTMAKAVVLGCGIVSIGAVGVEGCTLIPL